MVFTPSQLVPAPLSEALLRLYMMHACIVYGYLSMLGSG